MGKVISVLLIHLSVLLDIYVYQALLGQRHGTNSPPMRSAQPSSRDRFENQMIYAMKCYKSQARWSAVIEEGHSMEPGKAS